MNTIPKNSNVQVLVEQFPNEDHMSNFATSVTSAMRTYFTTILPKQHAEFSDDAYSITIRAKVPNENDELFITGNQESLGNWKSDQVKMVQVSPLIREITLSLRDHAAVTFYLNGTSQAWIKYGDGGQSTHPMMFRPKEGDEYSFEVVRYND